MDNPPNIVMGVIRWEDPPEMRTGAGPRMKTHAWAVIAKDLRDKPGDWGVVSEGHPDPSIAPRIKTAKSPWFAPAGSFQVKTRRTNGVTVVYARYIGEAGVAGPEVNSE